MRPALSSTQLRMIRARAALFVSDVDGTLTDGGYTVAPSTSRLIAGLEAVMRVAVLTGRSFASATAIARSISPTCIIGSCNGGYVVDPASGTEIHRARYEVADLERVDALARDMGVGVAYYTPEVVYTPYPFVLHELFDEAEGIMSVHDHPADLGDVVKFTVVLDPGREDEQAGELTRECPALVRSVSWILELTSKEASKEAALDALCRYLDVAPERAIGAGDGENDIAWMRAVGYRVVPEDAHRAVAAMADVVVDACSREGVAHFANALARA